MTLSCVLLWLGRYFACELLLTNFKIACFMLSCIYSCLAKQDCRRFMQWGRVISLTPHDVIKCADESATTHVRQERDMHSSGGVRDMHSSGGVSETCTLFLQGYMPQYTPGERTLRCPTRAAAVPRSSAPGPALSKAGSECSTIATWFNPKGVSTAGPIDPISARTDIVRPTVRA